MAFATNWLSNAAAEFSASKHFAITPHNTTNFDYLTRAIYVGVTGNVVIVTDDDVAVTYVAVPAGAVLSVRAKRVNSTGTTASSLVGMY
jgi:hypothetical protein